MTVQCCKCKKIKRHSDWIAGQAVADDQVSHSYCPACACDLRTELFARQASGTTVATARAISGFLEGFPLRAS